MEALTQKKSKVKRDYDIAEEGKVGMELPNNVTVLHFLQERYLSDGGARNPLILLLQPDLLQSYCLVGETIPSLVHHPVSPLPNFLHLLILQPKTLLLQLERMIKTTKAFICEEHSTTHLVH